MMMRRRRPLLRAATVAGAGAVAYHAGKRVQGGRDQDAAQDAQISQLQQTQSAAPPPAAGGLSQDAIEKLKELGQLHDQGVLSDAEFEAQKSKLLG
jgi:Short C-terminal domain